MSVLEVSPLKTVAVGMAKGQPQPLSVRCGLPGRSVCTGLGCAPLRVVPCLACGCWALGVGAGWLLTGMGVTPRLACVKDISSVPSGKDFVDLKDTANLWSI